MATDWWLTRPPVNNMKFSREFAMPNSETFSLAPVSRLLDRWLADVDCIVDPFARNSKRATLRNDLNPNTVADHHMTAEQFLANVKEQSAGVVLFDPPYSPRQITECYQQIGRKATTEDTQNARLYKAVKDELDRILRHGGVAICCGWNSMGMGIKRGYEMLELLLVPHGAAHNDTIVTVERKI
jgi:hypothetical protein